MDRVMVYIIHDRSIDEEVMEILKRDGIKKYTKWKNIVGAGANGPHLGNHTWPALNNVTMTVMDSEFKGSLLDAIKTLQGKFPFVGLRAIIIPVIDMV